MDSETTIGIVGIFLGLLYYFGLAYIPARIARRKGYSFGIFYILSLVASWWVMLIVTALLKDKLQSVAEVPVAMPTEIPVRPFLPGESSREVPVAPRPMWRGAQTCGVCGTNAPSSALACPRCGMPLQQT